jgi:magnesium transporter
MLRIHHPDVPTVGLSPERIAAGGDATQPLPAPQAIRDSVWVDLSFPLPHERQAVEQALGISLPDKADMTAIEASSRVYREGNAQIMNVMLVVGVDSQEPASVPVSLILTPTQLVTVRYSDPSAFRSLDQFCARQAPGPNPFQLLTRLMENIVDRTADILERMGGEIDSLSAQIFGRDRPKTLRLSTTDLQTILRRIGGTQFVLNKAHDSLVTLNRAASFLQVGTAEAGENGRAQLSRPDKLGREQLKSITRDFQSLSENCSYLTNHTGFLLDAALGRISIEQNAIVKIFSVAAVIFLPPTLVASVYGMNFVHMPELEWLAGYPMALGLMLLSAVLPYLWFKKKGWL